MKRKFTMPGQDALQALYPPMSEKDRNAILDTMRSLKNDAEEKSVMKRKLSFGLAWGLILVLLTCAALAVSAGVFGWFAGESQSGDGELFKKLDETSVQNGQTQTVAASDDAKYPAVEFTLSQSYYDGENLYISYSLKGMASVYDDSWTPDADELAKMEKINVFGVTKDQEDCVDFGNQAFVEKMAATAKQKGAASCIEYGSYLSDGMYLAGTDVYLDLEMSDEKKLDDGTMIGVKQFARPLCDQARNQDEVTLCAYLYRSATYHYFDGENWYVRYGERTNTPLYATVVRNFYNDVSTFSYNAEFDAYTAHGTVTLSALTLRIDAEVTGKNGPVTSGDTDKPGDLCEYKVSVDNAYLTPLSGQGWGLGETTSGFSLEYAVPDSAFNAVTLTPCYLTLDENGERVYTPRPEEAVTVDMTNITPTALPH